MTSDLVFGGGAAFAAALWCIAACVARQRELALGSTPYWIFGLSGIAAITLDAFLPPATAVLAGTSLIGALVCAVVDARTGYIFDAVTVTMMLILSVIGLAQGRFAEGAFAAAIIGAALGALYLLTGRRGIGLGDVKLGSTIALGYGLGAATIAMGSAFILGAVYAVIMLGLGRAKRSDALRFGPFIAGGAAVGLTARAVGWPW